MRPLKLEIEGFKSYVNKTTIDFTAIDDGTLFLISGKTGAGKSTIFDAMVYALYGNTTHPGTTLKTLMSKQLGVGKSCRVSFTFSAHGQTYCVTRQFKNNKNHTGAQELVLPGNEVPVTNAKVINQKIKEIIGLDQEQFSQVILLPQGDFQKFLLSNTKGKKAILKNIFKTEFYNQVVEKLKARFDEVSHQQDGIKQQIAVLMDELRQDVTDEAVQAELDDANTAEDSERFIAVIEQHLYHLRAQLTQDKQTLTDARQQSTHLRRITDALHERDQQLSVQQSLDQERPTIDAESAKLTRYRESADLYRTLQAQQKAEVSLGKKQQEQQALNAEQQAIAKSRQAFDEQWREWQPKINTLDAKREEQQQLADEARRWQQIAALTDEQETANQNAKVLEADIKGHRQQLDDVNQQFEAQNETLANLTENQLKPEAVLEARVAYEKQTEQLKDARQQLQNYHEKETELQSETQKYQAVTRELEETERSLTELAIGICQKLLVTDEPCPVCGSTVHPLTHPADNADRTAFESMQQQYDKQMDAQRTYQANMETLNHQLTELLSETHVQSLAEWEDVIDTQAATVASLKQTWDELTEQAQNEHAQMDALQTEVADLNQSQSQLKQQLASDKAKQEAVAEQQEQLSTKIKQLQEHVMFDSQEECQQQLQAIEATIKQLADKRDELAEQEQYLKNQERENHYQRQNVDEKIAELQETRDQQQTEIEQALAAHASWTVETVISWHEDWKSAAEIATLQETIDDFKQRDQQNRGAFKATLDKLNTLDVPESATYATYIADLQGLEQKVDELTAQLTQRTSHAERLATQSQTLTKKWQAYQEASGDYEKLNHLYQVFAGQGQLHMELETYVLRYYLGKIIRRANQRLHTMTQGRYQFKLQAPEAKGKGYVGLDMAIIDSYNGERDVATLSGGETFQASIALALGMSEVIQEQAGAIDMGVLFIDEGFGTLDEEEALPTAIDTLKQIQRESGRIIGLISHVSSLRDAASKELRVTQKVDGISEAQFVD